jgi:hypothetical protein
MKLEKVLNELNSFEKNAFLKILDNIISSSPKNVKEVQRIMNESSQDLTKMDSILVSKVFNLVQDEFSAHIRKEFSNTSSQLDVIIDIITKDGNCLMKQDWFSRLYEQELKHIEKKRKSLVNSLEDAKSDLDSQRKRDYTIYRGCLRTAYYNDLEHGREPNVSQDELSILLTLSRELNLSQEEIKLINYTILPLEKFPVDQVISDLKKIGALFFSTRKNTVYVPDELVRVLRKVRGKEVADKFFRRVLRKFKDSVINQICRKHNISARDSRDLKIKEIINEGISFSSILADDIYKPGTSLTEKKNYLNDFWKTQMGISIGIKGSTVEEKIESFVSYFEDIERDEKVGITVDGYDHLLLDLQESNAKTNDLIKDEFELQEENVLQSEFLLNLNIKPRDVVELIPQDKLKAFCEQFSISYRGDEIDNVLNNYKDSENLYYENFVNIGTRNWPALKENGITIKEAEIGVKFEQITKSVFTKLGFNVDDDLRKQVNTKNDKMDILLNMDNNEVFVVECKSVKEKGFNKFSSVSRQLKSYKEVAEKHDLRVVKCLLVAPDFSDEFVQECEIDFNLNLSLIKAESLMAIMEAFKKSKHKQFPHQLLMRDVLIQEERIMKALGR